MTFVGEYVMKPPIYKRKKKVHLVPVCYKIGSCIYTKL